MIKVVGHGELLCVGCFDAHPLERFAIVVSSLRDGFLWFFMSK